MKSSASAAIDEYFTSFLPNAFGLEFIEALPSKEEVVGFRVETEEGLCEWWVWVEDEKISAARDPIRPPLCSYRLSAANFGEIVAGRLSPQKAFFTLRLKVEGNQLYAIQLGALLEHFFQEHPRECP